MDRSVCPPATCESSHYSQSHQHLGLSGLDVLGNPNRCTMVSYSGLALHFLNNLVMFNIVLRLIFFLNFIDLSFGESKLR